MANEILFNRVNEVPAEPIANAVYFVAVQGKPELMEIYAADSNGRLKRVFNQADIEALIGEYFKQVHQLRVVSDIAARDALTDVADGQEVYVVDASADATVNAGGARYLKQSSGWLKTAEQESMDLALTWEALAGKPGSTAAQIDNAVAKSHAHANADVLDGLAENNGKLTYKGAAVGVPEWSSVAW